jgi:tetratricopeptide (TPR) repeat protein
MLRQRWKPTSPLVHWALASVLVLLPSTVAAEVTVVPSNVFDPILMLPLLISVIAALILWRVLLPNSLSNLQVAFETDDEVYEVHRLTRTKADVMRLLSTPGVSIGMVAYLLAMAGILLIVAELLIRPDQYYEPVLYIMATLIAFPILISPFVTLYAQLSGTSKDMVTMSLGKRLYGTVVTMLAVLATTGAVFYLGYQKSGAGADEATLARWIGYSVLAFMAPTILAYGRIMGASWNTLLVNKWRTFTGIPTAIDPDPPGLLKRFAAIIIVIFLATMPLTAINGIVTLIYVELENPADANSMLDLGGIIGWEIYQLVENNPVLQKVISLKALEITLASYLMMNVAIVGLAFIFELTRNLFLGGQNFGGIGGVILARPREIRSERKVQGKVLFFGLAGFSGYTVLLLILQTYKEFSHLMPYGTSSPFLAEDVLLQETWQFIAAGQAIFLLTWVLSISKLNKLKQLRFDLSPDERREGVILAGGGDWMRDYISGAAYRDDLDALCRFQSEHVKGDQLVIQMEKRRARMLECAMRGLWPEAIEVARKLLAQQGGEDDEARMIIAAGHIACRRLDAAREALRGLEQPEGYDEPELLAFIAEWIDPWGGGVTEDDFYDWENISSLDLLQEYHERLRSWDPLTRIENLHKDHLGRTAMLSSVAQLRAQRRHIEALDLALECVRQDPNSPRARIAVSLCLIDRGEWFDALDVFEELQVTASEDPRVKALGGILGFSAPSDELESALNQIGTKRSRKWVDDAPVNPVAALTIKSGMDEALNANVMIAAHESVERNLPPKYKPSLAWRMFNWLVLVPLWGLLGIVAWTRSDEMAIAIVITTSLCALHLISHRLRRQQRRVIKHRDQRAMVTYSRRLVRNKVTFDPERIPVGTHLLLSGLLVTINGVVYDLGLPGWLVVRLPKESERQVRRRMKKRSLDLKSEKPARSKPLPIEWWNKRPKPIDKEMRVLERLIGPAAYRGRQIRTSLESQREAAGALSPRIPMMDTSPRQRDIPTHSIKSEDNFARRPQSRSKQTQSGVGVTDVDDQ